MPLTLATFKKITKISSKQLNQPKPAKISDSVLQKKARRRTWFEKKLCLHWQINQVWNDTAASSKQTPPPTILVLKSAPMNGSILILTPKFEYDHQKCL